MTIEYDKIVSRIREAKGLTQQTLADAVGVTQGYVNQLENGTRKEPSLTFIQGLVKNLGVNPYIFIYPEETVLFTGNNTDELNRLKAKLREYEKVAEMMDNVRNDKAVKPGKVTVPRQQKIKT